MPVDWPFLWLVGAMAAAVLTTRFAGAFLMAWQTPSKRTDRFLEGLSVSVIAALVASLLVHADARIVVATVIALGVTALTNSTVWAMLTGMVVAAVFPHLPFLS